MGRQAAGLAQQHDARVLHLREEAARHWAALRQEEQAAEITDSRRSQVGTGERAEKIRTYNFPQDRVTDHRVNYTRSNLPAFLDGKIDDVIDAVATADQAERLEASLAV